VQIVALALCWLVYLFVVNEAPSLTPPLAVIVAVQSLVAIGQFLLQRNLGLASLGEPTLSPVIEGTSVLVANGQPWLRAYGLTGHPNALGALLAVLLLILLPAVLRAGGWRRWALLITLLLGLTGLLFSFSRNAWLAFGGGLVALAIAARASRQVETLTPHRQKTQIVTLAAVAVTAVAVLLLLGTYRDLIASRLFHPDIPIEATSLNERQRDAAIAVDVIGQHPWQGVGAGNYPAAGWKLDPAARTVHNVPLLVAAELGLPGLLLLVWLGLAPFVRMAGKKEDVPWYRTYQPQWTLTAAAAPWVALLLLGLFDVSIWLTSSWQAAIVLGLLVALQSRDEVEAK
jgi:O-antigen ligase